MSFRFGECAFPFLTEVAPGPDGSFVLVSEECGLTLGDAVAPAYRTARVVGLVTSFPLLLVGTYIFAAILLRTYRDSKRDFKKVLASPVVINSFIGVQLATAVYTIATFDPAFAKFRFSHAYHLVVFIMIAIPLDSVLNFNFGWQNTVFDLMVKEKPIALQRKWRILVVFGVFLFCLCRAVLQVGRKVDYVFLIVLGVVVIFYYSMNLVFGLHVVKQFWDSSHSVSRASNKEQEIKVFLRLLLVALGFSVVGIFFGVFVIAAICTGSRLQVQNLVVSRSFLLQNFILSIMAALPVLAGNVILVIHFGRFASKYCKGDSAKTNTKDCSKKPSEQLPTGKSQDDIARV